MGISATSYLTDVLRRAAEVGDRNEGQIGAAAELLVACVRAGGVIQAFGTGHSQSTALEVAGRAGGLIPTNRIALSDVVLFGGDDPAVLADPLLERDPATAARLYRLAAPQPADVFVIASNSGVNGSVVEMARLARADGHPVVAITSLAHSRRAAPVHGRLADHADVVLDNGAPYGDVLLSEPDGTAACAVSSITGALLVQLVTAEAVRLLREAGERPPVYVSANTPGGHERNQRLEQRYGGRLRRLAG
jgi:uncharacterized phosphosugar-binding protein